MELEFEWCEVLWFFYDWMELCFLWYQYYQTPKSEKKKGEYSEWRDQTYWNTLLIVSVLKNKVFHVKIGPLFVGKSNKKKKKKQDGVEDVCRDEKWL